MTIKQFLVVTTILGTASTAVATTRLGSADVPPAVVCVPRNIRGPGFSLKCIDLEVSVQ